MPHSHRCEKQKKNLCNCPKNLMQWNNQFFVRSFYQHIPFNYRKEDDLSSHWSLYMIVPYIFLYERWMVNQIVFYNSTQTLCCCQLPYRDNNTVSSEYLTILMLRQSVLLMHYVCCVLAVRRGHMGWTAERDATVSTQTDVIRWPASAAALQAGRVSFEAAV